MTSTANEAHRLAARAVPDRESDEPSRDHVGGSRPTLRVRSDPESITELRALIEDGHLPEVYLMGTELVRVEKSPSPIRQGDLALPKRAAPLTPALVQRLIAENVDACREVRGAWVPYVPKVDQIKAATAGGDWEFVPSLASIIGTPVLREDWTLLQTPGYDRATGLYLSPTLDMRPIPERPSPGEVEQARTFLLDTLLGDFPWASDADKANMLGALLTPYVRVALRAPSTPLTLITASMPSSGKTNLASMIGMLVGQQTVSWPSGAGLETELEKLISSTLSRSGGAVVFDNLENGETVSSTTLARLLTAPVWSGRILGSTAMGSWPNDREWIITGNNLSVGGDIPSRTIVSRLEPLDEHPEERTGFKIPDLESWLTAPANRAKVLRALLVLILDWSAAGGRPDRDVVPMRSFTSLVQGIGGILRHHGVKGYLSNVALVRDADEDTTRWGIFYDKWFEKYGTGPVRAVDLYKSAQHNARWDEADPWEDAFITGPNGRPPNNAKQLGTWLRAERRRPRNGWRIDSEKDRTGVSWWRLERLDSRPSVTVAEPGAEHEQTALSHTGA